MKHTCHAVDCTTPCKPEYLMCPKHWRMVPCAMQSAVYAAYRPGQCDLNPMPSPAWFDAAHAAVGYVAQQEGKPLNRRQREALAKATSP